MEYRECFATPVWSKLVEQHDKINEELRTLVAGIKDRENKPGVQKSNVGGWQSDFLDLRNAPAFHSMLVSTIQEVSTELHVSADATIVLNGCWINVNGKDSYNQVHTHPDSMLSGVYYVSAPENSGDFIAIDPRPQTTCITLPVNKMTRLTSRSLRIKPQAGRIVVFPSWLPHHVEANRSSEERVSIAFNLFFRAKE